MSDPVDVDEVYGPIIRSAAARPVENSAVRIYRKVGAYEAPTPTPEDLAALALRLDLKVRVKRPEVLEFFSPSKRGGASKFYRLPALSQAEIDNRADRIINHRDKAWTVPVGSLGRNGKVSQTTTQSLLIWITSHLDGVLVNADEVAIVVEPIID